MGRTRQVTIWWAGALTLWLCTALRAVAADDFEREPIRYSSSTPDNVVSRLQQRLAAGKVKLTHDKKSGYLRSVLRELQVPVSSQMLVYSKTSLQRNRISPRTPRALYFNDDAYVGYCSGGDVLELSAVDPQLGTVFYTLEQDADKMPRFARQTDRCTLCHSSSQTQGVVGHVVRSVFSDPSGYPILSAGTYRVDQTTAIEKRWGGWYVTGTHGKQEHLGNLIVRTRTVEQPVDNKAGLNVTDLGDRFERSAYLSGHSDIVALLVMEHQTDAQNYLTRANFDTRQALHAEQSLNKEMNLPATHRWKSTDSRIRSAGEDLLKVLLFSEEAPLSGKVRGTSTFAADFSKRGLRDKQGRSLRDFDLEKRLFRYPCSYLIYSKSFDALPAPVRDYVLERLRKVLTGADKGKEFDHLSAIDREAIREILVATKPNLPASWRATK
jgi:hypothetical protein